MYTSTTTPAQLTLTTSHLHSPPPHTSTSPHTTLLHQQITYTMHITLYQHISESNTNYYNSTTHTHHLTTYTLHHLTPAQLTLSHMYIHTTSDQHITTPNTTTPVICTTHPHTHTTPQLTHTRHTITPTHLQDCPKVMGSLMGKCWNQVPRSRPSFEVICATLQTHISLHE